jgi:hypothetical protein
MFYHLNELYGMTKCFDKFKIFSFSESIINGNIIYFQIMYANFNKLRKFILIYRCSK